MVKIKGLTSHDNTIFAKSPLPKDWDIITIEEAFDFLQTASIPRGILKQTGEIKYIHYGDIHSKYGIIIQGNDDRIPFAPTEIVKNLPIIENGDLIIADASEDMDGIGKSIEILNVEDNQIVSGSHTFLLRDKKGTFVNGFRGYIQFIPQVKKSIHQITTGISVFGISKGNIRKIQIPYPPKEEQQKIATALTDMDDLIESLEKIIDKKEKIKQGTMQQLLTGKKRLPGFDGEWVQITLGDIGATYTGLSGKTKADFSDGNAKYIPFINVMNNVKVRKNELEKVKINKSEKQNKVYKWDLIFNTSSETPEEVGMCSVVTFKERNLYLNSFCFGFRLNHERNDTIFLSYYFRSSVGRSLMSSLAQGSTRYNLSKNALLELELYIPKYNEQQAIAEILSDMDTEIELLEEKLEKYKKLKEGMMQELLTGRIRLV